MSKPKRLVEISANEGKTHVHINGSEDDILRCVVAFVNSTMKMLVKYYGATESMAKRMVLEKCVKGATMPLDAGTELQKIKEES